MPIAEKPSLDGGQSFITKASPCRTRLCTFGAPPTIKIQTVGHNVKPPLSLIDKTPSINISLCLCVCMAAKSPESSLMVNRHIDLCFDLDLAITAVDDTSEISKSTSMVSTMPTVTVVDACTVCREGFQSGEGGKQLPCGHVYHAGCIASWLSLRNSCPLCRCSVPGED